jgi:hypothetical protein
MAFYQRFIQNLTGLTSFKSEKYSRVVGVFLVSCVSSTGEFRFNCLTWKQRKGNEYTNGQKASFLPLNTSKLVSFFSEQGFYPAPVLHQWSIHIDGKTSKRSSPHSWLLHCSSLQKMSLYMVDLFVWVGIFSLFTALFYKQIRASIPISLDQSTLAHNGSFSFSERMKRTTKHTSTDRLPYNAIMHMGQP